MSSGDVTTTTRRCPRAAEHKSEANVMLLQRADGSYFCAVHGDVPAMIVRVGTPAPKFGALAGRRAEVLKSYWYNGEGWYTLRDLVTLSEFDSPDIFWVEA